MSSLSSNGGILHPEDASINGAVGPIKLTVKGPLAILVVVLLFGFGLVAYQVEKVNQAALTTKDAILQDRIISKGEHDAIIMSQLGIIRAQEDTTCINSLPADIRPAAVLWARSVDGTVRYRSICEYVVTVYLAPRRP